MSNTAKSVLAFLIGVILIQAAWIVAVPPFRGADEFDHAYRADGVARGQWRLDEPADEGRGLLVRVDESLAEAASAQCAALSYPGRDNCFPVETFPDGTALIATAAAAYNPAFYAVPGAAGRAFDGAASLYAMRIASALLCAILLAAAWWALAISSAGTWARLGFLVGLTPVALYSSIIPAPNGPEIAVGALLWTALLGAATVGDEQPRVRRALIALVGASGVLFMVLRTLGPVWVALIVLAMIAVVGWRTCLLTLRGNSGAWALSVLAVLAAFGVGLMWNSSAGLLGPSPDEASPVDEAQARNWVARVIVWTLQLVGAFPLHDEPAPTVVYALYFVVVVSLCALTYFASRRRLLVAVLCIAPLVIPVGLTLATAESQGVIWQGRYQTPFVIGLLMAFGWLLDQRSALHRETKRVSTLALLAVGASHAWSVASVSHGELGRSASATDGAWLQVPPLLLVVLVLAGATAWFVALELLRPDGPSSQRREEIAQRVGQ